MRRGRCRAVAAWLLPMAPLMAALMTACSVYDPALLERREPAVSSDNTNSDASSVDDGPPLAGDAGNGSADGEVPDNPGPACASPCVLDNAEAICKAGVCQVDSCVDAYLDCDGLPETGCEVDPSTDAAHCGDCETDCNALLPNTLAVGCGEGARCEVVSCADGFTSCDGKDETGCETSLRSLDNCGGCANAGKNEDCSGLPNVATPSCATQHCEVDSCVDGWANCDGRVDNGCEHELRTLGPCTPSLKRIAIDPSFIDAPLSDFPVLVRLVGDAGLMTARADGADIFFSSDGGPAGGASAFAFEIESFSRATGDLIAWVRIPMISDSAETVFYLRYGDGIDYSASNVRTGVWDAEFESIHHFNDGLSEATRNPITASDQNSTAEPGGQVGGARGFSGDAYVSLGTGVLPDEDVYTLSAWVKASLSGGDSHKLVMDTSAAVAPYVGMSFGVRQGDGAVSAYIDGAFRASATDFVADGTWTLVSVRYRVASSGGRFETSVNGQPFELAFTGDTADARNLSTSPFQIGRWVGGLFHFDGSVDELRVSSTARSDAWVRADYESQRSGSTFLRVEDQ